MSMVQSMAPLGAYLISIDLASLSETAIDLVFLGAPPGFRTQNLRIKSPLLCR